ncbi:DUF4320 family protein [Desulfurispora thermophila]|uniref:DUF4320 family protein n=1 Tax=Desulfurispora thermophila TaxID=265470 RepID=UPI00035FFC61|nr:DUF4320 family protein [Desulfurispora thermophila]
MLNAARVPKTVPKTRPGSATFEFVLFSILFAFLIVAGPDMVCIAKNFYAAHRAATYIVEQGAITGEIEQSVYDSAVNYLKRTSAGVRDWTITRNTGRYAWGMRMECLVVGKYEIISLRIFGVKKEITIVARKVGASQLYVR